MVSKKKLLLITLGCLVVVALIWFVVSPITFPFFILFALFMLFVLLMVGLPFLLNYSLEKEKKQQIEWLKTHDEMSFPLPDGSGFITVKKSEIPIELWNNPAYMFNFPVEEYAGYKRYKKGDFKLQPKKEAGVKKPKQA